MIRVAEIINPVVPRGRNEGGYVSHLFRPLTKLTPEMFNVHREDQPLGQLVLDHSEPVGQ